MAELMGGGGGKLGSNGAGEDSAEDTGAGSGGETWAAPAGVDARVTGPALGSSLCIFRSR